MSNKRTPVDRAVTMSDILRAMSDGPAAKGLDALDNTLILMSQIEGTLNLMPISNVGDALKEFHGHCKECSSCATNAPVQLQMKYLAIFVPLLLEVKQHIVDYQNEMERTESSNGSFH